MTARCRLLGLLVLLVVGLFAALLPSSALASTSGNLIVNGGPTVGTYSFSGFEDMTNPGWTITQGNPQEESYNNTDGDLTASSTGVQPGSSAFFHGGNYGASSMDQVADVSSAAAAIDAGTANYDLSGWLGGYGSQNETVELNASFLNSAGTQVGSTQIGPVTPAMRNNTTELLAQQTTGTIPIGTRSVKFTMSFATATGDDTTDGYAQDLAFTITPSVTAPTLAAPVSTVPRFQHVFLIYMENNNYNSTSDPANGGPGIIGNTSQAPYINSLLSQGSLLSNYHALTHSSDPNYVAIAAGQTFGHASGGGAPAADCISSCTFTGTNLGNELDAAGETWKQYIQSQTGDCDYTDSGNYEADDAPFGYFADMKSNNAYCDAHWQPLTQLTGTDLLSAAMTPNFVWADADSCNDMEGCGIAAGDTWLKGFVPQILASPAWTTQKSLLIITWDEDGNGGPGSYGVGNANQVATIILGSQGTVKAGYTSNVRYDHYSTGRTIENALGLPPMTDNDQYATPINDVFTGSQSANTVTVTSPGSQTGTVGTAITPVQVQASDSASGQTLSYTASGLPAGLSISTGGKITGSPTASGISTVKVTATDSTGATGSVSFTWTIGSGATGGGTLVSGGVYEIGRVGASQVIDDPASSTSASTQLIVWTDHHGTNQQWTATANADGSYTFKNLVSGMCMDDSGSSKAAGSKIIQWYCTGNPNQSWKLTASGSGYELVNEVSGLVLTPGGTTDGSTLTQQKGSQAWTFTKVG